jgi:hypothetical protein
MLQRIPALQRQTVTKDTDFRAAGGRPAGVSAAVGYLAGVAAAAIEKLVKAVDAWNRQVTGSDPQPKGQQPLPAQRSTDTIVMPPLETPRPAPASRLSTEPPVVQRDPKSDDALKAIQGLPMYALLPALAVLPPEVHGDRVAGAGVGGPRLTTAMAVVSAKGTPWLEFVGSHSGDLSSLPADQIGNVLSYLGAPNNARFYGKDQFDGRFDGAVDPVGGVIKLIVRVRFAFADGLQFGPSLPGTPGWEKETQDGKRRFGPEFKKVVESGWSAKGTVKPACPVGPVKQFRTEVQVEVVNDNEHIVFDVLTGHDRDSVTKGAHHGSLHPDSNEPKTPEKRTVMDDTGKHPVDVTNTQIPSRHEFGHAIGDSHVRTTGGDNDANYGKTVTERQDVMGAGDQIQVIQRGGKVVHDDLVPFERIGERWGKDVFGAVSATCNTWTGSTGS